MVVQCTSPGPPRRSTRHRRRWAGQSQRSSALPRLRGRDDVPAPRTSARRWRLPRCLRACHAGVSPQPDRARSRLATTSQTSCTRRARDRQTQRLANATGPQAARPARLGNDPSGRFPTQPPNRITGQLLAQIMPPSVESDASARLSAPSAAGTRVRPVKPYAPSFEVCLELSKARSHDSRGPARHGERLA
ncbi:MAG: hypothetical protein JWO36_2801 [Myxococcales bacterium]|nr:hypothetical protein [Myxococcales bacterium]